METLAQIEQYITGEMTGAERSAFEEAMQRDATLQQEVAAYKDIIAGIEHAETDAFSEMIQGWEKQIKENEKPQQAKVRRLFSPAISMALVAAVVLLLTFTFIFNPFSTAGDPFQQAFQPYPDEITIMGDGTGELDQQKANKAMALYNEGDYEEALPVFAELVTESPDIAVLKLYKGISELQTEDFTSATATFSALQQTSYAQTADWYQALTQLRYDNLPAGKTILTTIANTDGHPYRDQARELLEEL
jgi:tetratricopeptide (TPR) repeat protein